MENPLAVLAVVLLSTLVQSTFSFGGALVALPLLALVVGVKTATVLMTMLSCTIAATVVLKQWRHVEAGSAWRLIVSACAGIPFGILFLARADGTVLTAMLAITVMLFAILSLIRLDTIRIENHNYAYAFGLVSGLFGGAYNISGPPVVLYGSLANWSSERFRATIQSYALFTNAFAIGGHAFAGNVTPGALTFLRIRAARRRCISLAGQYHTQRDTRRKVCGHRKGAIIGVGGQPAVYDSRVSRLRA